MSRTRITALLAEDEAPQREALVELLAELWPELEVVAVCQDGLEAMHALIEHRPRVAILDIRMPGVSGLDVAMAAIKSGALVVFTTAYDEFAVRAFDAGALDYVLKPVVPERLAQALTRIKTRLEESSGSRAQIEALEAQLRPSGERLIRWISASAGDSVRMIGIDEVIYFQARDKYVSVITQDGEATIRMALKEVLAGLDPDVFWQVHRGIVVRVAAIDRLVKDAFGKGSIRLRDHADVLPVSSAFVHRFKGM